MLFSDKDIAEASLYEFFKQSWHVIEGHTEFVDEWYLKEISKSLEDCYHRKIKNLLIDATTKTVCEVECEVTTNNRGLHCT